MMMNSPWVQAHTRRKLIVAATVLLLAGCNVVPKGKPGGGPPPEPGPSADVLPADARRMRVALLVPLSGASAQTGQAIANAATMALLDTKADDLRITQYDTASGPGAAANRALADGARLILGPLSPEDVRVVSAAAQARQVPVLSYANDERVAGGGTFVMGSLPAQSIARTVAHARGQGIERFAALLPAGDYGQRSGAALQASVRAAGGSVGHMETYNASTGSLGAAARRLALKGGYQAVLIADSGRTGSQAAPLLRTGGAAPRILGTELWSGDNAAPAASALRGAWFSAVSDGRFRQFAESYRARFGAAPPRIATLGYDSVLLAVRMAREWKPGTALPPSRLVQRDAFVGVDGAFRFAASGVIERAFEVREVRAGSVAVISPAPEAFAP